MDIDETIETTASDGTVITVRVTGDVLFDRADQSWTGWVEEEVVAYYDDDEKRWIGLEEADARNFCLLEEFFLDAQEAAKKYIEDLCEEA